MHDRTHGCTLLAPPTASHGLPHPPTTRTRLPVHKARTLCPCARIVYSGDAEGRMFFWDWRTSKLYK